MEQSVAATAKDGAIEVIRQGRFVMTEIGLSTEGGEPAFGEWQVLGEQLSVFERGIGFLAGDWLNLGEKLYGEMAAQVIDARSWAEETVRVYRWVAERVPYNVRLKALSFKHHQMVAALSPNEQRTWLKRAEEGGWTAARLNHELRAGDRPAIIAVWLVVLCKDRADLDALQVELEGKGRTCKIREQRGKKTRKKVVTVKAKRTGRKRARSRG